MTRFQTITFSLLVGAMVPSLSYASDPHAHPLAQRQAQPPASTSTSRAAFGGTSRSVLGLAVDRRAMQIGRWAHRQRTVRLDNARNLETEADALDKDAAT